MPDIKLDREFIWGAYAQFALSGVVSLGEASSMMQAMIASQIADAMLLEHERRWPVSIKENQTNAPIPGAQS